MDTPADSSQTVSSIQPVSPGWLAYWAGLNQRVLDFLQAHPCIWLCMLAAILLLPGTAQLPLMDRDEPRFARATVEMMERGDAVIPWFNGEYRFDKPPLTYWWMALNYRLLGINELAARLHSVLAALGVALVIWALGARMFSRAAGFWAGTAWLSSFQVIAHGRLCVADMPMVLAVSVSMWAMYELLVPSPGPAGETQARPFWRNRWFWILAAGLGLGFLAKGPIAILVPLLALGLLRGLTWRRPLKVGWLWLPAALLLATILVGIWGIPALIRTHGEFWQQGVGKHVVQRGMDSFNGRVPLPFFYFATAFLTLLPWLARGALALGRTRREGAFSRAFLGSWLGVPYVVFSFYATQLPHYVLPGLGAFFLLLFQDGESAPWSGWPSKWWFLGVNVVWLILFGGLLAVTTLSAWPAPLNSMQAPLRLLVVLLLLLQGVALCFHGRQVIPALGLILACGGVLLGIGSLLRLSSPAMQVVKLRQTDRTFAAADAKYMSVRYTEPSLVFYQGGTWNFVSNGSKAPSELRKAKKKGEMPTAIVMLAREWTLQDHLQALLPWGRRMAPAVLPPTNDYSTEVDEVTALYQPRFITHLSGFNNGRTSWCELVLLEL